MIENSNHFYLIAKKMSYIFISSLVYFDVNLVVKICLNGVLGWVGLTVLMKALKLSVMEYFNNFY